MIEAQIVTFKVSASGKRLDITVASATLDLSRAVIQRLIKRGQITVNGRLSKPSYRVEVGDEIVVQLPSETLPAITAEEIVLDIIFQDGHLLAVNKPAGMVVHPSYGHRTGTLVNAILARHPETMDVGGTERAGIVHRLDKDTSGLILVARNEDVHAALQRQFKQRQVVKIYLALVEDHPEPRQGLIQAPIGRDKRQRKQMAIVKGGRNASTAYRVVERFDQHSLVELRPETGRTHQLRVHMAWLGFPVVGDGVYGRRKQRLLTQRHFLHAFKLELAHPVTGAPLLLEAPMPDELSKTLQRLRR